MTIKPTIAVVGIGNVGWNLSIKLKDSGYTVTQLIGRKSAENQLLSKRIEARLIESVSEISPCDIIFICVKDDAVVRVFEELRDSGVALVHTSGITPRLSISSHSNGVFYPFQSFTKGFEANWNDVPTFIDSDSESLTSTLWGIAESINAIPKKIGDNERQYLHIAGVFSSNFSNHLLHLIHELSEKHGLDFKDCQPLIIETIRKAFQLDPSKTQTGPASRDDKKVIERHLELLENDKRLYDFYQVFTQSILKLKK